MSIKILIDDLKYAEIIYYGKDSDTDLRTTEFFTCPICKRDFLKKRGNVAGQICRICFDIEHLED